MGWGLAAPLRIGVWVSDLPGDLRGALKEVSAWGLDAVGLDAFAREVAPRALGATGRRDLAHRLRAAGLHLAALRADVGSRRLADPKTLDANLGRVREAFHLARDLGAVRVVVPLGFVPPESGEKETTARKTLGEAARALFAFGAQAGIRPTLPGGSEPAEDLAAFLQAHDPGGLLEVDLNPGRYVARGEEPEKALAVLAARVGLASAADFYRGGGEAPFGEGDVPWGPVLVGLSTLGRGAPLPVLAACGRECERRAALRAAVTRLKKRRLAPMG